MIEMLVAASFATVLADDCIFRDGFECPPPIDPLGIQAELFQPNPGSTYVNLSWTIQDFVEHPCVMHRTSQGETFTILDSVQLEFLDNFVDIVPTDDTKFSLFCETVFFGVNNEGEQIQIGTQSIAFIVSVSDL